MLGTGRTLWSAALATALALGACGPDAESADEERRAPAPAGAEPATSPPAPEAPSLQAPDADPSNPPAEAPQPTLPPRERVIPVGTYPPPGAEAERRFPAAEIAFRNRPAQPAPEPTPDIGPERPTMAPDDAPPEPARAPLALEAGHVMELRVESELSTDASRPGDVFWATVAEDVLGSAGEVLIPMDARFRGRVVESRGSGAADEPPVLALELESVTVNGAVRPLRATVVEAAVEADARDEGTTTAAKVGAGAAAGALVGRILGRDNRSTVAGAVVGTAAGAVLARATQGGGATLPAGARLVIRLDERLLLEP